jgi:hypothetical protein
VVLDLLEQHRRLLLMWGRLYYADTGSVYAERTAGPRAKLVGAFQTICRIRLTPWVLTAMITRVRWFDGCRAG